MVSLKLADFVVTLMLLPYQPLILALTIYDKLTKEKS